MPVVTMRRRISGKRNGHDWPTPGETVDVSADEAQTLGRLGLAEVTKAPAAQPAAEEAAETVEAPADEPTEQPDDFDSMKIAELREVATERGLSTEGTKADLRDRLRDQ